MPAMFFFSAACAALACGPADEAPDTSEVPAAEAGSQTGEPGEAVPAKLIEFDGAWKFLKTSQQLRVWRAAVEFTLEVDETGHPSDCTVIDAFRRAYVNMKLCEVLMEHHSFVPARNARNEAVTGSYHSSLSYADLREQLD